jgi:hypothetical protein
MTSAGLTPVETDDTAFVTSSEGFILFADKKLNTVYMLKKKAFSPGVAYTAADGGPGVGTVVAIAMLATADTSKVSNPGYFKFEYSLRRSQVKHLGSFSLHEVSDCYWSAVAEKTQFRNPGS